MKYFDRSLRKFIANIIIGSYRDVVKTTKIIFFLMIGWNKYICMYALIF